MEEQASAAEGTPRSGLIDRWLATRTADDDAAAEGHTSASPHEEPPGTVQSAPARTRGDGPRSALSRLAERRAARGGQPRDFAAEILGALGDAPSTQSATPPSDDVVAARVTEHPEPADAQRTRPHTDEPVPSSSAAPVVDLADVAAAASPVEQPAGRLSLAGLRARRKEAGFDPLDTRIAGLESLVSEPAPLPAPDDDASARIATPAQEPITPVAYVAERDAERDAASGGEQTPTHAEPDRAVAGAEAPESEHADATQGAESAALAPIAPAEVAPAEVAPAEAVPVVPDAALAVAGSVPERDERAERLARMVRSRRGGEPEPAPAPQAARAEEQPVAEAPVTEPVIAPPPPAPPAALGEPKLPPTPAPPIDPLATLTTAPQGPAAAPATFDAPEIPAGVDVFASLRDSVASPPKKPLDAPVDVLAPLRDAHGMPAPSTTETAAEAAATTPSLDPPRQGGAHSAEPDPAADVTTDAEAPKPVQAGKRRAKVDAPPPNPAADDAIMAIALEAVLRAEGGTAPAPTTVSPAPIQPAAPEAPVTPPAATTRPAKPVPATPVPPQERRTPEPHSPQPHDDGDLPRKHRPPERPLTVGSGVPALVEFDPQRSTQHLLAMFLFLSVVATIGTGYLAYDSRGITEIAIAAFCGVLMLILWSAHSTAAPPRVKIEHGTLEVRSKDSHHRFDLTSPYTDLVATGTPGRRNWKVSIHRKSMRAFVIDSTMVDGREFMPVLEVCRAEARRRATDSDRRHHGQ